MNAIQVLPVHTRADMKRFIRFQWKPYEGNPYWVPPLLADRRKTLDRKKNPFYKHARMELFLAERQGELVGRIGAIVNDNHDREHDEKMGFFGFFECVDDQDVANALFDSAKNWLLSQGAEAMRGPASPSVNDEYGLLVDGFDKTPAVLMSYNPPYYARLVEGYGLRKVKDLYAYELDKDRVFSERFTRVAELARKRNNLVIRTLDMKNFERDVKIVRELYTRGWSRNWGEVPLSEEEIDFVAADLKAIVDPELVIFAESRGRPVGFGLSLPDINVVLKDNRRGYLIPGIIRLLLYKKRITYARVMILGVLPEYQNSGIGAVLFYETGRRCVARGYPRGEASWVLEDNTMMTRGAELMQGEITKTYRMYQMPIP